LILIQTGSTAANSYTGLPIALFFSIVINMPVWFKLTPGLPVAVIQSI
jgi:hypothetical protein